MPDFFLKHSVLNIRIGENKNKHYFHNHSCSYYATYILPEFEVKTLIYFFVIYVNAESLRNDNLLNSSPSDEGCHRNQFLDQEGLIKGVFISIIANYKESIIIT